MEGKLDHERQADKHRSDFASESHNCHSIEDSPGRQDDESGLFGSKLEAVPWTLRDVIIAAALVVPAGLVGSFALGFALARSGLVEDRTLAVVVGSALLPVALIAGAWVFGVWRHKVSYRLLGFRTIELISAFWLPMVALAIGLSTTAAYVLLVKALGIDILVPDQNLEEIGALDGLAQVPTFAIVGVLAPFGEEVFFRGFLLAALVPLMGGLRGAAVSSAIFSAAHINVGTLVPIFVMGMLLAWLYLRTGSIWPPFIAHAAQNLLALTFLELPIDAPTAILHA